MTCYYEGQLQGFFFLATLEGIKSVEQASSEVKLVIMVVLCMCAAEVGVVI
jgi:hypothetical protein